MVRHDMVEKKVELTPLSSKHIRNKQKKFPFKELQRAEKIAKATEDAAAAEAEGSE